MNTKGKDELIARYEAGLELSDQQMDQLVAHLQSHPESIREILAGRELNGILGWLGRVDRSQDFVGVALNRYAKPGLDSGSSHDAIFEIDFCRSIEIVQPARARRDRNKILWLAVAVAAFLLVSAALIQLGSDRNREQTIVNRDLENQREATERTGDDFIPAQVAPASPENQRSLRLEDNSPELPKPTENAAKQIAKLENSSLDRQAKPNRPVQPFESDRAKNATPQEPKSTTPSSSTVANPESFATLQLGPGAVLMPPFVESNSETEISSGKWSLKSGIARIEFETGTVSVSGPATFELPGPRTWILTAGNYLIETERKPGGLSIQTPHSTFREPANLRMQLSVSERDGTEIFVSRGAIEQLLTANDYDPRDTLRLAKNGLNQSLSRDHPMLDQVMIARGKQDFIGQAGPGPERITIKSPIVFANLLSQTERNAKRENASSPLPGWSQFVRRAKELSNPNTGQMMLMVDTLFRNENISKFSENLSDSGTGNTTSFQGNWSINGVQQKFNTPAEFERAMQEWFGGGEKPAAKTLSGTTRIQVNGAPFMFRSSEDFRRLRNLTKLPR